MEQLVENFLVLAGKDNSRLFGQPVERQRRGIGRHMGTFWLVAESSHAMMADIG
ncbi:MAG TPA: hypothetical protein VFB43_06880 [Terracidiphilus sp.]|nr:hypothetical protein [Terracidiphilus sp.]